MSDISYYKISNKDALAAFEKFEAEKKVLQQDALAFKLAFGAQAILFQSDFNRISFAGLSFNPIKDMDTWTKPDKQGIQRPRPIKSVKADKKQDHEKLLTEWSLNRPKWVNLDEALNSIGLNWANFFFGGVFKYFIFNGYLYLKSSEKPSVEATEIVGSEFKIAEAAYDQESK